MNDAMLLSEEEKFHDTGRTLVNIISAAGMGGMEVDPTTKDCLSSPGQGDDATTRNGRKIMASSLLIRGAVKYVGQTIASATTTVPDSPYATVWIIMDRRSNGAQLNSEDVLVNEGNSKPLCPFALQNLSYSTRFIVLKRLFFNFSGLIALVNNGSTKIGANASSLEFEEYFDFPELIPIHYKVDPGSGVIGDISDVSFHVIAACSADSVCQITYNSRMRFIG